jgi:porin
MLNHCSRIFATLLFFGGYMLTTPAQAEDNEPAVTTSAVYKLDLLSSRGGLDDASGAIGNLDLMLRADLDALWGWKDTVAYLHALADHGAKPNGKHTGSFMGLSNIEVPSSTAKLFHAWLQKTYLDDRLSLLAGLYPIDSEFSVIESAGLFLHPAYGPPVDLSMTRGPSIFNTSAVGVRVRWNGAERDRYAMIALLDGLPGDPADPHGTHIRFDHGDGAFAIVEFGYTPPERGHLMEPTDPSSPRTQGEDIRLHEKYESFGKYAVGFWGYSERVDDLVDVDSLGNPIQRRSRGAYLLAEKTLYRMPGSPVSNLAGFVRLSRTDGDSSPIDQTLNIGLRLREPFNAREDDIIGIAFSLATELATVESHLRR